MKTNFRTAFLAVNLFFLAHGLQAQCPFDPTVTGNLLLCPGSTSILSTQPYDAYQWNSRPFGSGGSAQPIPGATAQTLEVDAAETPLYISVSATLNGCTEQSPEVLVDGIAFLPLTVSSSGEFTVNSEGELVICSGDTVVMEALLPYTLHFQWYNGQDSLAGANDDTLIVTAPGSYWLTASPTPCPDWVETLGVQIPVIWGSTPGCLTSVKDPQETLSVEILPNPATDKLQVSVANAAPVSLLLLDSKGRMVLKREFTGQTTVDVSTLPGGVYVVQVTSKAGSAVKRVVVE